MTASSTDAAVSAVICTRDRPAYLKKAIGSLVDQTLPRDRYEVIVVDNASPGETRAVFDTFAGVPNVRYVCEPVVGLSQARNTGWQAAAADLVAYLDDDAVAAPDWLERIAHAFGTVQPAPGCVGGRVLPIWEAPRPPWLPPELESSLTIVDWGDSPAFIDLDRQFLAGTNVAYPRSLLCSVGGFATSLGRKGSNLLSNDEVLVSRALHRQGKRSYYDPRICVSHHVPSQRLTRAWFYRRCFWQAISAEVLEQTENGGSRRRGQWLLWGLSAALRLLASPRSLLSLMTAPRLPDQMSRKCSAWYSLGTIWARFGLGLGHEW